MSPEPQPRFPFPVPSGWFAVGWSDELAPGALRSLRYFGRELVLFRAEDGAAHVLDAYCPHLGAHLGCGGRVVRWQFATPRAAEGSAQPLGVAFAREFVRQFGQDIPIWESKRYLARPLLCEGDGAIAGFRRWVSQFYGAAS